MERYKIRTTYKSYVTIAGILAIAKESIPLENQKVKHITCNDCEFVYVGVTNRRITIRLEHVTAIKKSDRANALAKNSPKKNVYSTES